MFSLGVILFMTVLKSYPFRAANKDDKYYQLIIENSPESFDTYWLLMKQRFKKRSVSIEVISDGFKNLIFKLLCYDRNKRITIEELENDKWLNSPDFSKSKTRKELAFAYMQVIK